MDIIIAGDGEVGLYLAKALANENHNITIVDPHEELLKMVEYRTDLMTITGDSTSATILEQANVKKADLVLAVVHDEKVNLLTAMLAKKMGAKRVVARINSTDELSEEAIEIYTQLGIDDLVCPEEVAANEIISLLKQNAAKEIFDFSSGKLSLFLIRLDKDAQVLNKSLDQIAREHKNLNFRAVAINRHNETIIPSGQDQFLEGDLAYVITKPNGIRDLLKLGGKREKEINNVMIIGGGRVGRMAAKRLEKEVDIKLFEMDKERCIFLSDYLEDTLIINGDARSIELMEEEDIRQVDAFISVTNSSETNILTCLHAHKFGVDRTIALVENIDYIDISKHIGIDTIINKKLIAASHLMSQTMGGSVTSMKCLSGIDAEVMELVADEKSPITKKPIKDMKIPEGAIIGGIVRKGESLIAVGNLQIEAGDQVVVFALPTAVQKVNKLFCKK